MENLISEIILKYSNGNLLSRSLCKNGKLDGIFKQWYNNGSLYSSGNHKDGKRHGLYEYWWPNGTLISKGYYFNDKEVTEFEFDVLETCEES